MKTKTKTERQEEDQYWLYARESIVPVIRMITIFVVFVQILFMFEDWYASPDDFIILFKTKLLSITIFITAYLVITTEWGKKYVDLSMLIVCTSVVASISFQASIIGVAFMMPLLAILVTFISASLFPWKLSYHIAVTIVCITGVVLNAVTMQEPPYLPPTREAMAGIVFPAATILLAIFAHQRRIALWRAEKTLKESEERFRT
jgi:hypothetical protein